MTAPPMLIQDAAKHGGLLLALLVNTLAIQSVEQVACVAPRSRDQGGCADAWQIERPVVEAEKAELGVGRSARNESR